MTDEIRDRGPTRACWAAESALYFRPDGWVMACCSGWQVLGRVNGPEGLSLRSIWEGSAAEALRLALKEGDLSLGCFECARSIDRGDREASLASSFDRYSNPGPRAYPALMDFALSNRCNLQCVQCSGSFSSAIRARREKRPPLLSPYDDRFFDELATFLPHLERAQFKGGEPFLARENWMVWDRLAESRRHPEVSITTNGTVWNDEVERIVDVLGADIYVSVDAVDRETLRSIRVGIDPDRLWMNVEHFNRAVMARGRSLTLSFCLMSVNWHQLGPFLSRVDELRAVPDVIWVDGPGRFNLLTTPRERLAEVLGKLRSESSSRRPGLSEPSLAAWDHALERVQQVVDSNNVDSMALAAVMAQPVEIRRAPTESTPHGPVDAMDALGSPALQITYEQGIIVRVDAPSLSDWLNVDTWLGCGLEETILLLAAAGTNMRSEVEAVGDGSHRLSFLITTADGTRRLHGTHTPSQNAGSSRLTLYEGEC